MPTHPLNTPKELQMTEIKHRTIDTNGIKMHIAEAGEGLASFAEKRAGRWTG